jgi:hypothetical protein
VTSAGADPRTTQANPTHAKEMRRCATSAGADPHTHLGQPDQRKDTAHARHRLGLNPRTYGAVWRHIRARRPDCERKSYRNGSHRGSRA